LKLPPGTYEAPRVSPDGTRVAFGSDDGREAVVWIYDLSGATSMRRPTIGGRNRYPVWSPDGQRLAFQSDREGDAAIFWQRADGTGTAERLTKPDQGTAQVPEAWSPNGAWLLFSVLRGSEAALWTLSLPDRKAAPFDAVHSALPISAVFSPDGNWVAYSAAETGSSATVYVQPFPATGTKFQISRATATNIIIRSGRRTGTSSATCRDRARWLP
jgi:Tol biopolymer transport system component